MDRTVEDGFPGLCDSKTSYKHVSNLNGYKVMIA